MRRSHRWRQHLAATIDQLGRQIGGKPVVGIHSAFAGLPLDAQTGEATPTSVNTNPRDDQVLVTDEHPQAVPGRPEHGDDIEDQEKMAEESAGRDACPRHKG